MSKKIYPLISLVKFIPNHQLPSLDLVLRYGHDMSVSFSISSRAFSDDKLGMVTMAMV